MQCPKQEERDAQEDACLQWQGEEQVLQQEAAAQAAAGGCEANGRWYDSPPSPRGHDPANTSSPSVEWTEWCQGLEVPQTALHSPPGCRPLTSTPIAQPRNLMTNIDPESLQMDSRDIEAMTNEEFMAMVARHEAEWQAKQGERDAQEAAYRAWQAGEQQRQREAAVQAARAQAAERARYEAEGRWYDTPLPPRGQQPVNTPTPSTRWREWRKGLEVPQSAMHPPAGCRGPTSPPVDQPRHLRFPQMAGWKPQMPPGYFTVAQASPHPLIREQLPIARDRARIRERLGHARRRLFEDDESEEDEEGAGAHAGDTTRIVTMEEVLSKMTAAQARRRYAPSWAFVAWEVDRAWFAGCLQSFFDRLRWPTASSLPPAVRAVCRDSGVSLQELYVQEAFAPKYVAVARSVDQEWFDWLVDCFFSSGSWPRFDELPDGIKRVCAQAGVGPNDLV